MSEKTIAELNAEVQALKAECQSHKMDSSRRHDESYARMTNIEREIDTKVSFTTFVWIFGIMTTVLMAMFAYITIQINEVRHITSDTSGQVTMVQKEVSEVKGKLDPYNIQFEK